ncbi:MAG TPA: multiubiquitin domain-containing protein, partial [Flavisolibacter sp.]|nr:multiubiquitin domain-containing protein [Flavisolibacter sp.]
MLTKQNNSQLGGPNGQLPLTLIIEGREFEWTKQYITGKEVRQLAGLPDHADLFLSISDPWDDEQIGLDTEVNLGREGIESFYVRNPLTFEMEGKQYQWKKQFITGAELRTIGGLSEHDEIFLLMQKPYEDEAIENKKLVDLAKPGIEHFKVRKKGEDIIVSIRVNDQPYSIKRGPHTVVELKKLAGISQADELSELVNKKLIPLQDQASVSIKGGEEFFSCKREGSSS